MCEQSARNMRIYKLRNSGATFKQISESFSISTQRVHQIYRKTKHQVEGCWGEPYCVYCGRFLRAKDDA